MSIAVIELIISCSSGSICMWSSLKWVSTCLNKYNPNWANFPIYLYMWHTQWSRNIILILKTVKPNNVRTEEGMKTSPEDHNLENSSLKIFIKNCLINQSFFDASLNFIKCSLTYSNQLKFLTLNANNYLKFNSVGAAFIGITVIISLKLKTWPLVWILNKF